MIRNVKLRNFFKLPENKQKATITLLQVVKGKPSFTIKGVKHGVNNSVTELTFGEVIQLKHLIAKGQTESIIEAVKLVFKLDPLDMPVVQFYECVNFLIKDVTNIVSVEKERYQTLPTPYDDKLQQAGAEELNMFAELPIIDNLAGGDILKYRRIEKLPYTTVHFTLWMRAVKENINIRFQELTKQSA